MPSRAVFLDRDGTLIRERHYPRHPDQIALEPGIGEPLRLLQGAGAALVVVTNQSGLARGLFDMAALCAMHTRLRALLRAEGVVLDGIYTCPHHPRGAVPILTTVCECRKPRPGMIIRACRDLSLEPSASWMVGNAASDVQAGSSAGAHTALVGDGSRSEPAPDLCEPTTADALSAIHRRWWSEADFSVKVDA